MNTFILRSSVAIACALSLAACGGDDGNLLLGGSIVGLNKDGLVLQNNGGPDLVVPANSGSFFFPERIGQDTEFNVTVKSSPSNAICTPSFNKGRSLAYDVTNVFISCVIFTYDLGGTVSGLDSSGLVVVNGSERKEIPAGATSFTMSKFKPDGTTYESGRVADGAPYGITVLQQPTGRTCSIARGTGTMGSSARNDVAITCV